MAFPSTSVLDNFTRADANPTSNPMSGGDSWGQKAIAGGSTTNRLKIVSNQVQAAPSGTAFASDYDTTSYGPDSEVYCDVVSIGGWGTTNEILSMYARVVNPGLTTCTGYEVEIDANGTWNVQNMASNSIFTSLGTKTQVIAAGDSVGMKITGTGATVTIELWYKASGGSWTSLGTITDSGTAGNTLRRTAAGSIGIEIHHAAGNVPILDNFGGGTVVTAVTVVAVPASTTASIAAPIQEVLLAPSAMATTASSVAPVPQVTVIAPPAICTASSVAPTVGALTVQAPPAITTASIVAPVQEVKLTSPVALTTASIVAPIVGSFVAPAAMLTTASVVAPVVEVRVIAPPAITTASSVAPGVQVSVLPNAALKTDSSVAPVLTETSVVVAVPAITTASFPAPTLSTGTPGSRNTPYNVYGQVSSSVTSGVIDSFCHQVIRTVNDVVYIFAPDDYGHQQGSATKDYLVALRGNASPIPQSFVEKDSGNHPIVPGAAASDAFAGPDCRYNPATGKVHMIYQTYSGGSLRYAEFDTTSDTWTLKDEIIVSSGMQRLTHAWMRSFMAAALILDGSGALHVVTGEGNNIKHYKRTSVGVWTLQATISTSYTAPIHFNAVMDKNGNHHVVWCTQETNTRVGWAMRAAGSASTWTVEEVRNNTQSGGVLDASTFDLTPTVVVLSDGTPCVLWNSGTDATPPNQYSHRTGTNTWVLLTAAFWAHSPSAYVSNHDDVLYVLEGHNCPGGNCNLGSGNLHPAYTYSTDTGTTWATEVLLTPTSPDGSTQNQDGSASVRYDPINEVNPGYIDFLSWDERYPDGSTPHYGQIFYQALYVQSFAQLPPPAITTAIMPVPTLVITNGAQAPAAVKTDSMPVPVPQAVMTTQPMLTTAVMPVPAQEVRVIAVPAITTCSSVAPAVFIGPAPPAALTTASMPAPTLQESSSPTIPPAITTAKITAPVVEVRIVAPAAVCTASSTAPVTIAQVVATVVPMLTTAIMPVPAPGVQTPVVSAIKTDSSVAPTILAGQTVFPNAAVTIATMPSPLLSLGGTVVVPPAITTATAGVHNANVTMISPAMVTMVSSVAPIQDVIVPVAVAINTYTMPIPIPSGASRTISVPAAIKTDIMPVPLIFITASGGIDPNMLKMTMMSIGGSVRRIIKIGNDTSIIDIQENSEIIDIQM